MVPTARIVSTRSPTPVVPARPSSSPRRSLWNSPEAGCTIDDPGTIGRELNGTPRFINESGSTIFYTAPLKLGAGAECGAGNPNPIGLFARTGEAAPVQLNAPPPAQCTSPNPCASALPATPLYDGASADGSRVWFTTTQPLIDSVNDSTNDLYVAKLEPDGQLAELVQASAGETNRDPPNPGEGADVGEDGSTQEPDPPTKASSGSPQTGRTPLSSPRRS